MNSNHRLSLSTRATVGLFLALVLSASLPCMANVPIPPPTPPTPPGYCQTIATELTSDLNAFNVTLSSLWNGSTFPVLYAGNLPMADGNVGPSLSSSTHFSAVQNQLVELQAMGYKAVMIQVGFPVLYEPFYGSEALYAPYASFYAQVAATIRAMGMKIIVENDELLSSDDQAGWTNTAAFFGTLTWAQYQAARATMAATVAQVIAPDYLVLAEEPDSEAVQALQPNVNIPADAAAMIAGEIAAVKALGLPNPPLMGAGFGTWVANINAYISAYVALPLDYIDFHIYPINTENGYSLIANSLIIANAAAAAGKPVAMSETWLWKLEDSEWRVLTPDQYRAREPFGFWESENILFLQTIHNLANYTQMLYQAPSEPDFFFAGQDYGGTTANGGAASCTCTTASCSPAQVTTTETSLAQTANLQSVYTPFGIDNYKLLVTTPDTIAPSTPINLVGSTVSTVVNLSWTASTDNVGVAGYNVIRNGVWIANSSQNLFKDSGLATSTTYNYQIQAFDMAGNTSASSSTVAFSTVYTIPPTTPANVVATAISPVTITVTWSASQDPKGVSSYEIFRGVSPSSLVEVATVHGTTLSYNDVNLVASTKYYYGVEATQASYVSSMSANASAITLALPSGPTGLKATATSAVQVSLTWTASTAGLPIAAYHVLRGTSSSTLTQITSTPATSYTDKSLSASTTYYYAVQATDSGGNASPMSVQVSITTLPLPNTPTGLVATATAATKIVLTWTDTVPPKGLPILNYQVYCGLAPGSLTKIAMASGGSYTYTGLTPGTMYYCAVLASDTAGDLSPTSAPASAMTAAMPATPTSVIGTANASTNVTVAWTENVAAGGLPIASYQIYRGSSPSNLVKLASRTTTSYVDTAVSAQTTYFYAVQATDTAGDISLMSTTSQVVVPLAEKLLNGRLPWVLAPSKPGAP